MSGDATLETHAAVVIRGDAVCGFVRPEDALAGTLRVKGEIIDPEKARPILQKLALAFVPFSQKEICTRYEPSGADFTAKISIGGTYRADQDETVKWISPAEGYTVTP